MLKKSLRKVLNAIFERIALKLEKFAIKLEEGNDVTLYPFITDPMRLAKLPVTQRINYDLKNRVVLLENILDDILFVSHQTERYGEEDALQRIRDLAMEYINVKFQ